MEVTDSKEAHTCMGRHIHASRVLDPSQSWMPAGSMAASFCHEAFLFVVFFVFFLLYFFLDGQSWMAAGSMAAASLCHEAFRFCFCFIFFSKKILRGWLVRSAQAAGSMAARLCNEAVCNPVTCLTPHSLPCSVK